MQTIIFYNEIFLIVPLMTMTMTMTMTTLLLNINTGYK